MDVSAQKSGLVDGQVNGCLKVVQRLGFGSFGAVFRMVNTKTRFEFARKETDLSPAEECVDGSGMSAAENAWREVAIHEQLQHKNIIGFFDWFQEDQFLYLNMELAAGCLDDTIKASARGLPSATCRQYFRDLILGVEYLHFVGIAHRDINTENLLIGTDGYIKIADFGISIQFRTDQGPAKLLTPCGTDKFMAPEVQMPGEEGYDAEPADIWACAIVLVEMLTKRTPWTSTCVPDYGRWRTNQFQEPFDLIDPNLHPLICKMLDEVPWKRATIHEIKEHSWFPKK